MSNAFALKLPEFDDSPEAVVVGTELPEEEIELEAFDEVMVDLPQEFDVQPSEEEDHWVPDPGASGEQVSEKLDGVEKLLTELAMTAQQMQSEMAAQVEKTVQGIAAALFPKLAEAFLADEISRFLAYAVPQDAMKIEIYAPAPLEPELTDRLSQSKSLHSNFVVLELPPEAEPMVKVNWGDGGFDYDLTSLLAACCARTFQNGHEYED